MVVDTLTGEWKLLRADVLHDAGNSLNPAIDIGQVEGAFIQGMGWLTTEELWWNRERQADDARAVDLQDSRRVNDCPPTSACACSRTATSRTASTAPRRSASRRCCCRSRCSSRSAMRSRRYARAADAPKLRAPATPEATSGRRLRAREIAQRGHRRARDAPAAGKQRLSQLQERIDASWLTGLQQLLAHGDALVLVTVALVEGSAPREPGTKMIVTREDARYTIGGGHLEWNAIEIARQVLRRHAQPAQRGSNALRSARASDNAAAARSCSRSSCSTCPISAGSPRSASAGAGLSPCVAVVQRRAGCRDVLGPGAGRRGFGLPAVGRRGLHDRTARCWPRPSRRANSRGAVRRGPRRRGDRARARRAAVPRHLGRRARRHVPRRAVRAGQRRDRGDRHARFSRRCRPARHRFSW